MLPYPPEYSTGRGLPHSGECLRACRSTLSVPAATELEVVDFAGLPLPVAPEEDARGRGQTPIRVSTGRAQTFSCSSAGRVGLCLVIDDAQ
jgi:hypothetical protein